MVAPMDKLFLVRAIVFGAVQGGFSSPAQITKIAAEFQITASDALKAARWLADNGFLEKRQGPPSPRAPRYIEYAWHYFPGPYVRQTERLTELLGDKQAGTGYGADIWREGAAV